MTTISFQISDTQEIERLLAVLRAFDVENITQTEDSQELQDLKDILPLENCIGLEKSIFQAQNKAEQTPSEELHQMIKERYAM